MSFKVPESFRLRSGRLATDKSAGNNGAFQIPPSTARKRPAIFCIASDGEGWEHVSVSIPGAERCPKWDEMCAVKEMFWDDDDAVIQFHPPRSDYVNTHRYCLHLWRPIGTAIPLPASWLVGVKGLELA